MNKIKLEIKSLLGNVLFEYKKENNTIKDTLEKAIVDGANVECGSGIHFFFNKKDAEDYE